MSAGLEDLRRQVGRRVRLVHCSDEYTGLAPGAEGIVTFVDDVGTVHVEWDDGFSLGLLPGADAWDVVS